MRRKANGGYSGSIEASLYTPSLRLKTEIQQLSIEDFLVQERKVLN